MDMCAQDSNAALAAHSMAEQTLADFVQCYHAGGLLDAQEGQQEGAEAFEGVQPAVPTSKSFLEKIFFLLTIIYKNRKV